MFTEATQGDPNNSHCLTDELHRNWLEYEDGSWRTCGIPSNHGGKPFDDSARNAIRVEP